MSIFLAKIFWMYYWLAQTYARKYHFFFCKNLRALDVWAQLKILNDLNDVKILSYYGDVSDYFQMVVWAIEQLYVFEAPDVMYF